MKELTLAEKEKIQAILLKLGKSLTLSNIDSIEDASENKDGRVSFHGIPITKEEQDFIEYYWINEVAI